MKDNLKIIVLKDMRKDMLKEDAKKVKKKESSYMKEEEEEEEEKKEKKSPLGLRIIQLRSKK